MGLGNVEKEGSINVRNRGIALVAGLGLAFSVAVPASAQDLTDADTAAADFLGALGEGFSVSDVVEETLENVGLEEEEGTFVTTDATPFNPVDDEGSVTTVFVDDLTFGSEVVETEE